MLAELVKTMTSDGLRLDGALHVPEHGSPERPTREAGTRSQDAAKRRCDAVICLHGVGSNFYGGSLFEEMAEPILATGCAVLRVNTRGHDGFYLAGSSSGASRQGAAYETVDHCRHDMAAWIEFLAGRGWSRIALVGHSLGAIKAVYSQAHQPDARVKLIVAMSPPRLSHRCFQHDPNSPRYFESLQAAGEQVDAGRPEALIQARFPFPLLISAASYLDKYGPGERYNIVDLAAKLDQPALFTYGEAEVSAGSTAFAGVPDAVQAKLRHPASQVQIVPGADHNYTGRRADLIAAVQAWLQTLAD